MELGLNRPRRLERMLWNILDNSEDQRQSSVVRDTEERCRKRLNRRRLHTEIA